MDPITDLPNEPADTKILHVPPSQWQAGQALRGPERAGRDTALFQGERNGCYTPLLDGFLLQTAVPQALPPCPSKLHSPSSSTSHSPGAHPHRSAGTSRLTFPPKAFAHTTATAGSVFSLWTWATPSPPARSSSNQSIGQPSIKQPVYKCRAL